MKRSVIKKLGVAAVCGALAVAGLAGCGASGASSSSAASSASSSAAASADDAVITVGASPTPHAEILAAAADELAKEGYELKVVEYNDYVLPNTSLENGEIDANYFQHITYLNDFNEENGTHLASAAEVHYEPLGLYAGKIASLDALKEAVANGDAVTIAVPNDTTNEARALLLLEQEGILSLDPDAGITATQLDIVGKPNNLTIQEIEAAQVARVLPDVDAAVVNGNYAIGAGLAASEALAVESAEGTASQAYANVIAVKEGDENTDKTKALVKALQSDAVKAYIDETYDGAVVALF